MNIYSYIYVWDFDETLVRVEGNTVFIRPYAQHVLNRLWHRNNIYTVLWSAGDKNYIFNCLSVLNWFHYFKLVLTRENCELSQRLYGSYKSRFYLDRILRQDGLKYSNLKYIYIDDLAKKNAPDCAYDTIIEIPPYLSGEMLDMEIYKLLKNDVNLKWVNG